MSTTWFSPDVVLGVQPKDWFLSIFVLSDRRIFYPGVAFVYVWTSVRVIIGFLVTSLTMTLIAQLMNLAGQPALERDLVFPNFSHFTVVEPTVFLGTFKALEKVSYPCPYLCLEIIWSQRSVDSSFDFTALLWSDMHLMWDLIHKGLCLSK